MKDIYIAHNSHRNALKALNNQIKIFFVKKSLISF